LLTVFPETCLVRMKGKKAYEFSKIVEFAIGVAVLIVIILIIAGGPKGLLNKVAGAADSFSSKYIKGLEAKNINQGEEPIPRQVDELFVSLSNAFDYASSHKEDKECFIYGVWIHNENLEKDYKIIIENNEEGTLITVKDKVGHIVDNKVINNIHPCIVGGQRLPIITQNFYNEYLLIPENARKTVLGDDYDGAIKAITIIRTDEVVVDDFSYSIETNGELKTANDQVINLLYKPDADHLCFIATIDGNFYNAKGVSDRQLVFYSSSLSSCYNGG